MFSDSSSSLVTLQFIDACVVIICVLHNVLCNLIQLFCFLPFTCFSSSGLEDAFAKRKWGTEVVDYGVPYDFESIMHYPFTAFSKNGKPTIRNVVPMNGKVPYVELSDGDAQQTNAMYKCNGKPLKGAISTNFFS